MVNHSRSRSLAAIAGVVVAAGAVAASVAALPANAGATGTVSTAHSRPGQDRSHARVDVVNLVADTPGKASITDPHLVNAWGLAAGPSTPLWVSDNGTSLSTLYQGATSPGTPVMKVPLDVQIPGGGAPTGVVFNPTKAFLLHGAGKSGPAAFIFAGENGDLSAWSRTGDVAKAVLVAHTANAVYKGLTMVTVGPRLFLLAANFHRNRIDVFDRSFTRVDRRHAFASVGIPHGYAPFDVATLNGLVYVTYAQQDAKAHDDVPGPGHGFVNVFAQNGRFLGSLLRGGVLDSPWGLAIAPQGFGHFAGKLLVGNFGDGHIHVVDQRNGRVLATLQTRRHQPVEIDGLWGLLPGNGTAGGTSDVWFSAGPGGESHGLLGILRHR
jgi:uncharacterized protein (TIGR03118 family)